MDKTKVVNVRLSEETLNVLRELAKNNKKTISQQVRDVIELTILPEILLLKVENKSLNFEDAEWALYDGTTEEYEFYSKKIFEYSEYIGKAVQEGRLSIDSMVSKYESLIDIFRSAAKRNIKAAKMVKKNSKLWFEHLEEERKRLIEEEQQKQI
jgi:predicted DNA-binding protein